MAYVVRYTASGQMERNNNTVPRKDKKLFITICITILLVFAAVKILSVDQVQQFLIPGDPEVTRAAFAEMTQSVRQGQPVDDAVIAFCRQILACAEA